MGAVLFRLALLALGMGLIEIGLTDALGQGSLTGWGIVLLGGFPLVLLGTAGFIGPLVGAGRSRGDRGND
jgi:hypothetical protein